MEWWTGEINGRTGLFPRIYCEEVAEEKGPLAEDALSSQTNSMSVDKMSPRIDQSLIRVEFYQHLDLRLYLRFSLGRRKYF